MPPEAALLKKRPQFFYGWLIVATGFLGDFMTAGVAVHSFGFIIKPMTRELNWTRAQIMAGASMRTVTSAFSGVVIGPLIDRYGARPIMVVGALVGGIGIVILSQVGALWHFYLIYGLMGAVGMIAMGGLVTSTAVAKWFIRKRGRAIAIVAAGLPLGGAVLGPITQQIIEHFSWRVAWVILGGIILVILTPLAGFFMRRRPEDMGLLPDGDEAPPERRSVDSTATTPPEQVAPQLEVTWTLRSALRTPTLWVIILSFILSGMGLSAAIFHQTAYISDKALPSSVMSTNMVVFGIAAAAGSLFWGFLAERIPVRYCVMAAFFVSTGGLAIFITAQNTGMVISYAVTYGIAAGGFAPLESITMADYYGRTFLGTIRGVVMPLRMSAMAGGPLFAAYVFDATQSYDLAFTIFAATYLLAAVVMFLAKPPTLKTNSETRLR